jgi:hypothetical protein
MTVQFVVVKATDQPGTLGAVAEVVAKAGVNILAFAADASGVRLLTADPPTAAQALHEAGYEAKTVEVVDIEVTNRPGELARVGKALGDAGINIESTFGLATDGAGTLYIRVQDADAAWDALQR